LDNLESKAEFLYKEQKYPEALDIFLSLYRKSPKTEKYSIFCGNCFDALGDDGQAVRFYRQAAKINPVSKTALVALINIYYANEDYANAEKFARRLLKAEPNNISALLNLGNIAYCRSDWATALSYYERAYKENPSGYIAVINMANTCYDLGRYVKALNYAQLALKLYPSSVDAYIIVGNAYLEMDRYEKAEVNLLRALEFRQDNPWIYASLSRLYQKAENWEQALLMGWNAVLYAGKAQEDQHINFGYLLYECVDEKGKDMALEYAKRWQERFSDNPIVKYMAQAILNDQPLTKTDPSYLKTIFDQFAADFDTTLAGLEYQVPTYIADLIKEVYCRPIGKPTNWLDLGCGTGLCAQAVKPLLAWCRLDGVDLSAQMLHQAAEKKIYDKLYQSEIVAYLDTTQNRYQLMTAGDVLTYFGELHEVFDSAARVLTDNGLFVFSISENAQNKENYYLTPSGRFVHAQNYLINALKKSGFSIEKSERQPLRNEGDRVVYGWIVAARKVLIIQE
jgi:predicted TPR repeat methyltransferase/Flp pilus assembly protein TadD